MICEMCGRETGRVKKIIVEGSILTVCNQCARFGVEMEPEKVKKSASIAIAQTGNEDSIKARLAQRQRRMRSKDIFSESSEKELVEDYHKVIQQARMALGMNQEELARKLNERKSIIAKLETKSLKPDNKLIRKLEKTLKIELMEKVE